MCYTAVCSCCLQVRVGLDLHTQVVSVLHCCLLLLFAIAVCRYLLDWIYTHRLLVCYIAVCYCCLLLLFAIAVCYCCLQVRVGLDGPRVDEGVTLLFAIAVCYCCLLLLFAIAVCRYVLDWIYTHRLLVCYIAVCYCCLQVRVGLDGPRVDEGVTLLFAIAVCYCCLLLLFAIADCRYVLDWTDHVWTKV